MRIIVRGWGDGALIFQETLEFDEPDDGGEMRRCSTWLEAERQHAEVVEEVRSKLYAG